MREITSTSCEIEKIHRLILNFIPKVSRIACVLWDQSTDNLYTYANSTRTGVPIKAYQFPLSASKSLTELSETGNYRYISNISENIPAGNRHSDWLLAQGYQTSLTVPMHQGKRFLGLVFFNSGDLDVFDEKTRKELCHYAELISATVSKIQLPIFIFTAALNLHDFETENHLSRVAGYSYLIASRLVELGAIDDELAANINLFAPMHDLGKVHVSKDILLKDGKLDEAEFAQIKEHVENGLKVVEKFENLGMFPVSAFTVLKNIIAHHHEKLDGSGYPNGLKEDEISIEAKIVGIADIFDALTSRRSYKPAWSINDAFAELHMLAQVGKLDPLLVTILENEKDKIISLQTIYSGHDENGQMLKQAL
jgi:HD-GYP domain-containing protein (c-di-GMP phosphodiesterase class II)